MDRIVQIVPRFPPVIDGVGDFARELGTQLQERYGTSTVFLNADRNQTAGCEAVMLQEQTALALSGALRALNAHRILLHYSGYGYHQHGMPSWLVNGLDCFLGNSKVRLSVFFHEVWSAGPFWTRSFYAGFAQKRLAFRLRDLANVALTSTPAMRRLLSGDRAAVLRPISSSVSEPDFFEQSPSAQRATLVIFGQEHSRSRTLKHHDKLIRTMTAAGLLESLFLVGKDARQSEVERFAGKATASRTIAVANAAPEQIRNLLLRANAMLSFYPAHLVTKSSSIMTALSLGRPVVLPTIAGRDPYQPAPPLLGCDGTKRGIDDLLGGYKDGAWGKSGQASFEWYRAYASWKATTAAIATAMGLRCSGRLEAAA